jgi:hypothetical protein
MRLRLDIPEPERGDLLLEFKECHE